MESIVVASVFSLLITLTGVYLTADYFTGQGVDRSVLFHLQAGFSGAGWREYLPAMAMATVGVVLAIWLPWLLCRHVLVVGSARSARHLVLVLLLPLLLAVHPTTLQVLELYGVALPLGIGSEQDDGASVAAGQAETAPLEQFFVTPGNLEAQGRPLKNLVFIYLESFERTYFDEALFPGLAPNLKALEKQSLHFTDIRSFEGAGFTIGGMVASQCGLPLISPGPNSMNGMDQFLPGVTCLGDLLANAGYRTAFLGGASLEFAGKGKFYHSHGFDSVEGLTELKATLPDPDYLSYWGLYDDTLFGHVTKRYETMAAGREPFALFALTLDTHHPNGHPSASCQGQYGDGSNPILNAVHCSDQLVAQFIQRIRRSPAFANTLLVVASDHVALRNTATDLLKQGERRNLLMLFDGAQELAGAHDVPASTFDTGPTVLHALGWPDMKLGLGRDLLASGARENFRLAVLNPRQQIRAWREPLDALWQFPSASGGVTVDAGSGHVAIDGREFLLPMLMHFDSEGEIETLQFEFDTRETLVDRLGEKDIGDLVGWVDDCERMKILDGSAPTGDYCAFFGKIGAKAVAVAALQEPFEVSAHHLQALAEAPVSERAGALRQRRLANYLQYGAADIATHRDAQAESGVRYPLTIRSFTGPGTASLLISKRDRMRLPRGINLVAIDHDARFTLLKTLDGCAELSDEVMVSAGDLALAGDAAAHALVVSDSAICTDRALTRHFPDFPLAELAEVGVRVPYVAYATANSPAWREWVGFAGSHLIVKLRASPAASLAGRATSDQ
ncbi:sulfatase-like hydrolase/transferase [Parahaliea mediterranea]|uniref:sulfatase-like hydrolase/transferase n=1 Tax=Parahaliea mediterranea TaxID=651086 RepID=UPI001300A1D6|nr:sulfatase-like hydrolase/transferase [Parahaliea mediterranea]